MDVSEFTTIKEKVRKLELESASAKGKMETIEQTWEKKYGFKTLEEAEKKLSEIEADIKLKEGNRDSLMNTLEKSFDWNNV